MMDVQGIGEEPLVEEDFTNSSLVKIGEGVAVYAAYHDDREPSKPTVRLIVILSAPKPKRRVLCHFHTADLLSIVEADQYELCENHKKKYLGFIYSCPVPGGLPSAQYKLSLSAGQAESESESENRVTVPVPVPVPVMDVSPAEIREGKATEDSHVYRYNFSVCVSPLFGSVLAKRLVEFLELTHMLGVQQVFFYDFQLSSVIHRVLAFYRQKGYVTVLPWKLPASMGSTRIWYHGQLVTNNDCLYRTMPLSAFTAFHDIDEFIVPHHPHIRTLHELLPGALPNDTCGYSFQSAFYDPGISSNDFADDLMTVALTARPAMLSKIRTKVLVAPRRVFEVGIHHISKQFREHWAPRRYDSTRAILHHYRQCIHDYGMRCENWVKDTIIRDRYLPELKTRMQDVVRTLRL
ncbi:beta-1,4-galactosyltransferase galt-1-like [Babylonia areolata]|uniref:beta-1,4-galactosyltransferase galt-1-like n=1 Tax=Babylonia areolata TaxID=304850 RepID=UPI003FD5D5D9